MSLMQNLVRSGELTHLVAERLWKETERALCERSPDIYIQVLRDCGALAELFPEVEKAVWCSPARRLPSRGRHRHTYIDVIATGRQTLRLCQGAVFCTGP
jgi:tRNA nucleotidyltransferase (CCA-adding enzyme)